MNQVHQSKYKATLNLHCYELESTTKLLKIKYQKGAQSPNKG